MIFTIITLTLIPTGVAFGSHIFDDRDAFAQYLDIAQLSAEKYALKIDEKTYDIYYGYHGSFEVDVNKIGEELPKLSTMNINTERKSIEITMERVSTNNVFWLRLPLEVISAENAQYKLVVDGVDTKYDLTKFPDQYAIGMIIPKDTKHIEIIGTHVVPEFGAFSIIMLTISFIGIIYFARKSHFGPLWTRIN
ncbi:MAG TPA: PEFG-CTERM sorting domain-containing protein [Nitrosarchaeum sp.]